MLVLSMRLHEKIMIGENIEVRYVDFLAGRIRLVISTPASVPVLREKVMREMQGKPHVTKPSMASSCKHEPALVKPCAGGTIAVGVNLRHG
ncbi:MAG: carbon storage regulator [Planctomycetia bacterium]|nr:carbon storage regulator [Planctomycetia bacterium]